VVSALSSNKSPRVLLAAIAVTALTAAAGAAADIGPGPDSVTLHTHGYLVKLRITPNSARRWNDIDLSVTRRGSPVRRAAVSLRLDMPAMSMGAPRFQLREVRPGVYRYSSPAISMGGLWVLTFQVRAGGARAFTVVVRDHVRG
jgi:YtkA-like